MNLKIIDFLFIIFKKPYPIKKEKINNKKLDAIGATPCKFINNKNVSKNNIGIKYFLNIK